VNQRNKKHREEASRAILSFFFVPVYSSPNTMKQRLSFTTISTILVFALIALIDIASAALRPRRNSNHNGNDHNGNDHNGNGNNNNNNNNNNPYSDHHTRERIRTHEDPSLMNFDYLGESRSMIARWNAVLSFSSSSFLSKKCV